MKKSLLDCKQIMDALPHGSGINYRWIVDDKGRYYRCQNAYDFMDENGFDDCVMPFFITIPKKNPDCFKLHFFDMNGHRSYMMRKYGIRDYLETEIYNSMFIGEDPLTSL